MRKKLFLGLFFLVLIGGLAWWFKGRTVAKKKGTAFSYTVKKGRIVSTLDLAGVVNFEKEASLRFQTSGLLSWVGVKAGSSVRKGQAIASLDRRQLYKQLKKALNNYYNTRLDFEDTQDEYRDVLDRNPQIGRILEKSQKNLDNAVLNVELEHLAWQLAVIKAPFSGVIDTLILPQAGVNITPSQATFHLIDPCSAFFEAEVDELDLAKIKVGQEVKVSLDAYPQASLSGKVKYISYQPTKGKSGSMVYLAKIVFDQLPKDFSLRSGLNGQAHLKLAEKENVLVIPEEYLNYENGRSYVWLEKGKKKEKRFIQVGLESDEEVEVTQGLKPGNVIVE